MPVFDLGGAEKQGHYIAKSMKDSGLYDVEVWALNKSSGMLIPKLEEDGLPVKNLNIPFSVFQNRWARLRTYWTFLWAVRRAKFEIILPFTYHCNVLSASVFRFAGVKQCLWFQIAMEYHIPLTFFEKIARKMNPTYASNSYAAGRFIAEKHGISAENVHFIPNPFEKKAALSSVEDWRNKLQIGPENITMVMAANFFPEKDHITLIHGLVQLLQRYPQLILVFAGSSQPETNSNKAKALAFDLGIGSQLKFIGSTNDIPGLLATAHIGILSSRSEGSPNALIEYMGYGLPVLATNIPAISELLGADYPFLFELENIDDFVEKTSTLIQQLESSQGLVNRNREIIETEYTIHSNFNAFHKILA